MSTETEKNTLLEVAILGCVYVYVHLYVSKVPCWGNRESLQTIREVYYLTPSAIDSPTGAHT